MKMVGVLLTFIQISLPMLWLSCLKEKHAKKWGTLGSIADSLNKNGQSPKYETIRKTVERCLQDFRSINGSKKQVSGVFYTADGQPDVVHYHPDLVAKVIEQFVQRESLMDGRRLQTLGFC